MGPNETQTWQQLPLHLLATCGQQSAQNPNRNQITNHIISHPIINALAGTDSNTSIVVWSCGLYTSRSWTDFRAQRANMENRFLFSKAPLKCLSHASVANPKTLPKKIGRLDFLRSWLHDRLPEDNAWYQIEYKTANLIEKQFWMLSCHASRQSRQWALCFELLHDLAQCRRPNTLTVAACCCNTQPLSSGVSCKTGYRPPIWRPFSCPKWAFRKELSQVISRYAERYWKMKSFTKLHWAFGTDPNLLGNLADQAEVVADLHRGLISTNVANTSLP